MADEKNPGLSWFVPPDITPIEGDELAILAKEVLEGPKESRISYNMSCRLLATVAKNVGAFEMIREVMVRTRQNMIKPAVEAKVAALALGLVHDLLLSGSAEERDQAINILVRATNEVALSVAGKLDLDVAAWAQIDLDVQSQKAVGGQRIFGDIPALDSLRGTAVESYPRSGRPGPNIDDLAGHPEEEHHEEDHKP